MLFLIFTHVDTCHHAFIIKEEFSECLGKFRLTHTGGTEEDKRTNRTFRILQTCTTTAYGIGNSFNGFILPDDTLVKFIFQMQQFILFALQHLTDGDACPTGYYICNVFGIYFFLNHGFVALHGMKLLLSILNLLIQSLQLTVTDFGNFTVISLTFSFVCFEFKVFYFNLILLDSVDQCLFTLPFGFVRFFLFFQFGKFLTDLFQFRFIVFAFDGFALNLQLFDLT